MFKKRLFSLCIAFILLFSLAVPAAADSTESAAKFKLTCTCSYTIEIGTMKLAQSGEVDLSAMTHKDDLNSLLGFLAAGSATGDANIVYTIDPTKPCIIECINNAPDVLNDTATVNKKVIITADENVTADDAIVIYNTSSVTFKGSKASAKTYTHSITFGGGVEVQSGATLNLNAAMGNLSSVYFTYHFDGDLVVDGTLNTSGQTTVSTIQALSFSEGNSIVIGENGLVSLDNTSVTGSVTEDSALITNNGTLTISKGQNNASSTTISATSGVAIENNGDLTIEWVNRNGALTISATDKPAIVNGGTLTLEEGEITATAEDVPAITVAEGATLVIPEDSAAVVTAENNDAQAIDLAGGAIVKKSDIVTVIVSEENDAAGENYVDNNGIIHLAAGAKTATDSEAMNAAIVLADGTIIQGSTGTAPKLETSTGENGETIITVTIPAGGSVHKPGETPVSMPNGGSIVGDVITANKPSYDGLIPPVIGSLLPIWGSQVQSPFVDVTAVDYYYNAVNWAVENGITTGTGRYSFSPDEACTRAQAVTFLWRAAGSPAPKSAATPFVDVDSNAYYYKAVLWAVENGITNGTSDTTFSPSATCTRAQIVTFLYRAFGRATSVSATFTDVAVDAYYAPAVAWAAANSITGGTGSGKFSPAATCTRAQIVTFLYRCCQN